MRRRNYNNCQFTDKEKDKIIQEALYGDSDAGRQALAKSMVEPIRRAIDYQSIGRKLFGVQPLPSRVVYGDDLVIPTYNKSRIVDISRKIEKIKSNL